MKIFSGLFTLFLCAYLFIAVGLAHGASALAKVTITSGSASERDGVLYVAQDLGLFKKHGLDLTFVQVRNGPVAMSALSSGETQFHWGFGVGRKLGSDRGGRGSGFHSGLYQSTFRDVRRQFANQDSR